MDNVVRTWITTEDEKKSIIVKNWAPNQNPKEIVENVIQLFVRLAFDFAFY